MTTTRNRHGSAVVTLPSDTEIVRMDVVALLVLCSTVPAAAGDFGIYGTYWETDELGETAGGGIRAGKQDPVFQGGNDYLMKNFPKLDYIKTARVVSARE